MAIDIAGLEVPVSVIDDPDTREMFARLGYDRLSANYGLKLQWNEADETLNIENIHAGFEDMGSLTMSLELSGLPRAAIENPETIEALVPTLSLVRGKITFKNEAIVGRGLRCSPSRCMSRRTSSSSNSPTPCPSSCPWRQSTIRR